jgi:hypothetical protein
MYFYPRIYTNLVHPTYELGGHLVLVRLHIYYEYMKKRIFYWGFPRGTTRMKCTGAIGKSHNLDNYTSVIGLIP